PHTFRLQARLYLFDRVVGPPSGDYGGAQCSLDRTARQEGTGGRRCEGGDKQELGPRPLPLGCHRGMLEWNAPAGEILGKAAPGSEVQLFRAFQLAKIRL